MIRVLLAEDHPLFRDALGALLAGTADLEVAGVVDTVAGLRTALAELRPDVAVIDLELADGSALDSLPDLKSAAPQTRVLVLTTSDDDNSIDAVLRAGARGYLLKSAAPAEIVRAVRTVADGDGVYDGAVLTRIAQHVTQPPSASSARASFPQLTEREREVLALMAQGLSNAEIADHFVLSLKTVRNHVSNVLAKLRVATRAQAIVAAREADVERTGTAEEPRSRGTRS